MITGKVFSESFPQLFGLYCQGFHPVSSSKNFLLDLPTVHSTQHYLTYFFSQVQLVVHHLSSYKQLFFLNFPYFGSERVAFACDQNLLSDDFSHYFYYLHEQLHLVSFQQLAFEIGDDFHTQNLQVALPNWINKDNHSPSMYLE